MCSGRAAQVGSWSWSRHGWGTVLGYAAPRQPWWYCFTVCRQVGLRMCHAGAALAGWIQVGRSGTHGEEPPCGDGWSCCRPAPGCAWAALAGWIRCLDPAPTFPIKVDQGGGDVKNCTRQSLRFSRVPLNLAGALGLVSGFT